MKKVSLLSFYLIATVVILSSGNNSLVNATNSENSILHTEKVSEIGGETGQNPSKPHRS
jgi:hypothetical protein